MDNDEPQQETPESKPCQNTSRAGRRLSDLTADFSGDRVQLGGLNEAVRQLVMPQEIQILPNHGPVDGPREMEWFSPRMDGAAGVDEYVWPRMGFPDAGQIGSQRRELSPETIRRAMRLLGNLGDAE